MPPDWDRLRREARIRRKEARSEAHLTRLEAEARADPGNPALWGLYCEAKAQALYPRVAPRAPKTTKTCTKGPLIDVLALCQSRLSPETLWQGPAPQWPAEQDPSHREDPEE